MSTSRNCPCKDCVDRQPGTGCHDRCSRYQEWKKAHDEKKEAERQQSGRYEISDAKIHAIWRKKRYSRQGGRISAKINTN